MSDTDTKPRTKLEHALALAARGWPVFPLQIAGKAPITSNSFFSATRDPGAITEFWTCPLTHNQLDYNIGVRPVAGEFSVIDLDRKHAGIDGVANFEGLGGKVAGTVVATPSGGLHVFVSGPAIATTAGKLAPGIDTRASDSYVVGAGSVIDGVTYRFLSEAPMLPVPEFVLAQIPARVRGVTKTTHFIENDQPRNIQRFAQLCKHAAPASAGCWHSDSCRLAAEAVRCAVTAETALDVMREHWVPRGTQFAEDGRDERWPADVEGSYQWALKQGEHGVSTVDAQLLAFSGVDIVPAPPDTPATAPACGPGPVVVPPGPNWTLTRPTALQGAPVPRREFIVDQWLSPGHTTILYGDGGTGKSLLTQQLMTACATGAAWCGLPVVRCRALALACEDDDAKLHRRQASINAAMGLTFADLNDMAWISGVGEDNTLVTFDREDRLTFTPAFERLAREVCAFQPRLIIVDTAADTFGGDEVRRRQVRQFVGAALGKLAKENNAAVLLNAHPSRSGMGRGGDLDGGSTAWSNTARARWSLTRPEGRPGEVDPDERVLTRRKSNYASIGDTVRLKWEGGAFVPVAALTGQAWLDALKGHEAAFMRLLNQTNLSGRNVSPSKFSAIYAPKVFSLHPAREGRVRSDFEGAMERLFNLSRITSVDGGRVGRPSKHIVPTPAAGEVGCGSEPASNQPLPALTSLV